jgi:hypothetical protein
MGSPPRARALLVVLALLVVAPAPATAGGHAWYVPDHLKLQLAGNVGFLSPGAGYAWAGRRLETDVFLGWVPRAVSEDSDILSMTGKVTWLPWKRDLGAVYRLHPLTLALQLTYTFGDDYYVSLPARYPPQYYDFPTALRAGVGVGGALGIRLRPGRAVRQVAVYYELVALDFMLLAWARNQTELGPLEVFSLAIGTRVDL